MRLIASPPLENMTYPELGSWVSAKIAQLQEITEFPAIEVRTIASFVLQKPGEWIIAHPQTVLSEIQLETLEKAIARLIYGEPLAYITGRRSFYGLDLMVDKRVLVPRPETELLVELAIDWLQSKPGRTRVADIGTGSGAIAIALANQIPELAITAVDSSSSALEVARANAALCHLDDRVEFLQNDLLDGVSEKFDLILANLPYIPSSTVNELAVIKHEPRSALDGGPDGISIIERLIKTSKKNLALNGCIILEIQYNQGNRVQNIALNQFPQAEISIYSDLAGLPRVVKIQS